jgi:hypothetical protein
MRSARGPLAVVAVLWLIGGCGPDGFVADPGYRGDVWNRSSVDIVIEKAPFESGLCYALSPDELGNVAQGIGDSLPTIRIWRAGSQQPEQIVPSSAAGLFVVTDAGTQQVVLTGRFDVEQGRGFYDMPEYPEIDGQLLAPELPLATNCRPRP